MKSLFTLFLTCISIQLFAQPQFITPGAEWWHAFIGGQLNAQTWSHTYVEKDTTVNNLSCKKLITEDFVRYGNQGPFNLVIKPRFIRQSGDSVFLFEQSWKLLWRTNPNVGDTYTFPEDTYVECKITVDSIKEVNINGKILKKIYQKGYKSLIGAPNIYAGSGQVVIYSEIGPEHSIFDYTRCWGAYDCFSRYLCQFKNDEIPLYNFNHPYASGCNLISSAPEQNLNVEIKVQPNPCTDFIQFEFNASTQIKGLRLSLVDQTGHEIKNYTLENTQTLRVETSDLPAGVYYYFGTHEEGYFAGKFIKTSE